MASGIARGRVHTTATTTTTREWCNGHTPNRSRSSIKTLTDSEETLRISDVGFIFAYSVTVV